VAGEGLLARELLEGKDFDRIGFPWLACIRRPDPVMPVSGKSLRFLGIHRVPLDPDSYASQDFQDGSRKYLGQAVEFADERIKWPAAILDTLLDCSFAEKYDKTLDFAGFVARHDGRQLSPRNRHRGGLLD